MIVAPARETRSTLHPLGSAESNARKAYPILAPREIRVTRPGRGAACRSDLVMWLFRSSSKGRRIAPRGRIDEEADASTSPRRRSISTTTETGRQNSSSTAAAAPARSSGVRAPPTPEAVSPHDLSRRLQALATLEIPPDEDEDDDEDDESPNHRSFTPPLAVAQPAPAMQRSSTPPLALALRKGGVVPEKKTSPLSREPSTRGGNHFFNLDARSGASSAAISREVSVRGGNAYNPADRLVRHASFKDMSPLLASASSDRPPSMPRSRGLSRSSSSANLSPKVEP